MRFRKLAGLAAGALSLGMLSAPTFMAPANATVTTPATASFTCGSGMQSSTYNATITLTLAHNSGAAKLSAKFSDMPNGAPPQFVNWPGATISNKLTVAANGVDTILEGSHTSDFIGGTATKMPTATGALASRPSSISIKSFSYKVVKANGDPGTAQECTLPAPVEVAFADEPQLEGVNATCNVDMTESGFGGVGTYPAKLEMIGEMPSTGTVGTALSMPVTSTITLGREFSDYLQSSPVYKVTGEMTPTISLGETTATGAIPLSTWNRTLAPGSPIGQPINEFVSITGTGPIALTPTSAGTHQANLTGGVGTATMTVTFGNVEQDAPIDCVLDNAASLGAITVAEAGPTQECIAAQDEQAAAQTALVNAQAAVTTAKSTVTKAQAKVRTLTAKVKALTAKVKKLSAMKQTPKVKRQLKAAKKQLATAKAQLKTAKAQLAAAKKKLAAANAQVTAAQSRLAAANADVEEKC